MLLVDTLLVSAVELSSSVVENVIKIFCILFRLAQGDVVISSLVGCNSSLKSKLVQIESELNTQRNKNNVIIHLLLTNNAPSPTNNFVQQKFESL